MILTDKFVSVNYDMNDYLPESSPSTVALNLMDEEFDGGVPNARVMVANVTIPEALAYKEQIEAVDGVTDVTWLDDAVSVNEPLEIQDQDTKVEDTIDDMVGSLSGGDAQVQSFVSDKNTNIASVQFVIKTTAIEKMQETVQTQAQTEKLSFWEKLINLFRR